MSEDTPYTLTVARNNALQELESFLESSGGALNASEDEVTAFIQEAAEPGIASNAVLLRMALEDLWLATSEPDDGVCEPSGCNCIRQNIYEHLYGELNRAYNNAKNAALDEDN